MAGIDNILKAVKDLKDVVDTGSLVLEDKQLSLGDVRYLPALWGEFSRILGDANAAKDAGEISDIDLSEVGQIGGAILDLGAYIAQKVKAGA